MRPSPPVCFALVLLAVAPPSAAYLASPVDSAVRQHLPQLRACYLRALQSEPALRGRVVLHLTIEPTGRVRDASVDAPPELSEVGRCLVASMREWRVAPWGSSNAYTASFPLVLQP